MMAAADHSAWKFREAPLFAEPEAPFKRASLEGYAVDDLVWVSNPGYPGQRRAGKVINIFHKAHLLLIRVENPATHIQLNPVTHGHMLTKRFGDKQ